MKEETEGNISHADQDQNGNLFILIIILIVIHHRALERRKRTTKRQTADKDKDDFTEGNGKYSEKDRCSYVDTARGSAFECAGDLDNLVVKKLVDQEKEKRGKEILQKMIPMLIGFNRNHSDRFTNTRKST